MGISEMINDAIEYILIHIEENVTAESVADHCHVSRFYFTRIFKQQTGESVYAFIKKKKLEFSAFRLKSESDRSITEIASQFGYSSSNYSSAFSDYFGMSPNKFRHEHFGSEGGIFDPENKSVRKVFDEMDEKIRIKDLPEYSIIYERRIGAYSDMKKYWREFCDRYDRFCTPDTLYVERTFDDPSITDADKCLYDICMSDEGLQGIADNDSTCHGTMNGGRFAVCPFKGYLSEINQFHHKLMGIWLPLSGNTIDTRYSYDVYHKVTEDYYMEFDVCIPVK